jgi:hypothetical protein
MTQKEEVLKLIRKYPHKTSTQLAGLSKRLTAQQVARAVYVLQWTDCAIVGSRGGGPCGGTIYRVRNKQDIGCSYIRKEN